MQPRPTGPSASDPVVDGLEVYIVGGAVRDDLLGLPAGDRDWVVVGASPEALAARGFTPVGGDFPVFLHPRTHEEYALARTERKSGRGYHGFVFHAGQDVTLEEDLQRRDLTVNAIARAPDGRLIDPLNGANDIAHRVLRHAGPAFVEDPVRLLRLARFAARFHDFSIAPETLALCHELVQAGEVDALVPERVWQEFAKGLITQHPQRMFAVLAQCGALPRVAPGLVWNPLVADALARAAACSLDLAQRYAVLCCRSGADLHAQLRVPTACRDLARLLPGLLAGLQPLLGADPDPAACLDVLEACDALRRPERCLQLLEIAACLDPAVDAAAWQQRLQAVRQIDAGAVARAAGGDPTRIRADLRAARIQALAKCPLAP